MIKKTTKPHITLRVPSKVVKQMKEDLRRSHAHAWERVGFLFTRSKTHADGSVLIIATDYRPVADEDYIEDSSVGAKIGVNAIRSAMQQMRDMNSGCFHIHMHSHLGKPAPSGTDSHSLPGVVESFSNIAGGQAVGLMILSKDNFYSAIRLPGHKTLRAANLITVVGFPMRFYYEEHKKGPSSKMFDRQSFLGEDAQFLFQHVNVGVIGYGGGGSHIGQQLAHIGFLHPYIFDDDHIEESNLNRLVGGRWKDVLQKLAKTTIAKRTIKAILPSAKVTIVNVKWQDDPEKLQQCDLVIGSVDTYSERQQLEAESRRYLIPLIDLGMDVHTAEGATAISGQVMLSMPGQPCFWCYGFLTEEKLGREAAKYGNVGGRPQVVWPNGVLASTGVGLLIELVTGWTSRRDENVYLEYDGNAGVMKDHIRLRYCSKDCDHFHLKDAGPVRFVAL